MSRRPSWRILAIPAVLFLFLSIVLPVRTNAAYTIKRQRYVAPNGANVEGTTPSQPMNLRSAIATALPGDLVWLKQGVYSGKFLVTRAGTPSSPIIYRALPGNHVTINGGFQIQAANNWVWGMEITDPHYVSNADGGVSAQAPGVHIINNIIHHQYNKNGITSWSHGPGILIYGNIVYLNGQGQYHPHNIYAQNDYAQYGYKRVINNMFLDSAAVCDNCFNVHVYTEQGMITGFYLQNNIVKNGRFLIGGFNFPATNEWILGNFFYRSQVQLGYRRPTQARFQNNYLGRSPLWTQFFWGLGETKFSYTGPNVYTGNQIIRPPSFDILFRTSVEHPSGRCDGCSPLRPGDIFDHNTYSAPFAMVYAINGKGNGHASFQEWKQATAAAGNAFDVNSAIIAPTLQTKVVVLRNIYEKGRGHVAIYNWSHAAWAMVNLSGIIANGSRYQLLPAESAFGAPVVSGTYQGPVQVPLNGQEFAAFLVKSM